jgi:MoxR-like ATPase
MVSNKLKALLDTVNSVIIGKEKQVRLIVAAFLAKQHVLIEDPPGLGKTALARTLARALSLKFSRIQLTPDVLPLDLTGSFVFKMSKEEFEFKKGPVFTNILLADELNRTTPRTQSALLEAMEERQVTVEGKTFKLEEPFFVIATQNPFEHHGTFPLPESQLDRFGISLSLGYPSFGEERDIVLENFKGKPFELIKPVMEQSEVVFLRQEAEKVKISNELIDYAIKIVRATRELSNVVLGASPRASIALVQLARAYALLENRDYVLPDDIKQTAPYVLRHRLLVRGLTGAIEEREQIVQQLLTDIEPPVI